MPSATPTGRDFWSPESARMRAVIGFPRREYWHLRDATAVLVGDPARADACAATVRRRLHAHDPGHVLAVWEYEGVLAFAQRRAAALEIEHPAWQKAAEAAMQAARASAAVSELAAVRLTGALAEHGVPSLVLKGSTLGKRLYGATGLRPRSVDLDLLVSVGNLRRAERLLRERGWGAPQDPLLHEGGLPDLHLELAGPGAAPTVELHWRVQWFDDPGHATWLLSRAVIDRELPVADPIGLLSVLLLCWARDGFHRLRLGADIAGWWNTFGDDYGDAAWGEFGQLGVARPLWTAGVAASVLLGVPAPPAAHADWRARAAVRLALCDHPASQRELFSRVVAADVLASPRTQVGARLTTGLLRSNALLRSRYPQVPLPALPALRGTSAIRTTADLCALAARASRRPVPREWP